MSWMDILEWASANEDLLLEKAELLGEFIAINDTRDSSPNYIVVAINDHGCTMMSGVDKEWVQAQVGESTNAP